MYKTLKKTDILVFGGGGVLETHNNSFTTTIGMMYKFSKVYLAKLLGVKVYCFAVGSNTKPYSKLVHKLVSILLKNVDGISTRDQKSFGFLKEINSSIKIKSLADPAMLLELNNMETIKERPFTVGINVMPYYKLLNGDKSKLKEIRSEIAKCVEILVEKYKAKVFFIPMVNGDDTEEQSAILELISNTENVTCLLPNYSPNELMVKLSNFDLFIGTRLHPNILAFNVNTPIIGIAYHDKIFSLFDHIQFPDFVHSIQNVSSKKIIQNVIEIMENREVIKTKMNLRQKELKVLAKESFEDLLDISKNER